MNSSRYFFCSIFLATILASGAVDALPKYGPDAMPLSRNTNHDYFVKNLAPDFWALMPFYTGQPNDRACSATSFTMVLNALRDHQDLTSQDELVTVPSLLEKYTSDEKYKKGMADDANPASFDRSCVANKNLTEVLKVALDKLKMTTPHTVVENHVIDQKNLGKSRKEFHDMLVKNEKSSDDFMVMIFIQGRLTGDPEGMVAHVAPIGAYDEKKHLVLVMDPDRKWYEPYWSAEDKVFDAIADPKSDEKPSWIYVKVK